MTIEQLQDAVNGGVAAETIPTCNPFIDPGCNGGGGGGGGGPDGCADCQVDPWGNFIVGPDTIAIPDAVTIDDNEVILREAPGAGGAGILMLEPQTGF